MLLRWTPTCLILHKTLKTLTPQKLQYDLLWFHKNFEHHSLQTLLYKDIFLLQHIHMSLMLLATWILQNWDRQKYFLRQAVGDQSQMLLKTPNISAHMKVIPFGV
ncbi:hypothetical protein EGW08_002970 [Elysia chlorotica]|uniref:Uncharacterized protein n=1 Tax=Elysia chlorotica TaxID=188477 RepID=A0A433U626_ELYCH|nr:hypothetical protein EGW08_002970 [Elysia chlorotica]